MRIAYTIFSPSVSGAEKRVIKLALSDWFREPFRNILILNRSLYISALDDKELSPLLLRNKEKVKIVPDNYIKYRYILLLQLLYLSLKMKINIFHCYLYATTIGIFLALFKIKVVYEITSPDSAKNLFGKKIFWRFLYNRVFRFHCVSESVYNFLINNLRLKNYPFISKIVFSQTPYTKIALVNPLNVNSKSNTLIYACRFIERKNVVLFAKVAKEILANHHEWSVKIFGKGKLESEIKGILSEEVKNGRAFIGYTNDMIKELNRSKIICSYIEPDNYPSQSLFEGLACSNAIVVSDTGNSKIFIANNNGVLSKMDSPIDSFVKDIERLINNEKLLKDMQRRSKVYYEETFSETRYFKELVRNCYNFKSPLTEASALASLSD